MGAAESIGRALGGREMGPQWVVRCVAHDDRTPSLALRDGDGGRLLVHCYAGCDPLDILSALRRLGLGGDLHHADTPRRPKVQTPLTLGTPAKVAAILARTVPIHGKLAERYLQARGCAVPYDSDLRYLPPTAEFRWPTMVAIITDLVTGVPMSLHFTALDMDGSAKAPIGTPKRLLGGHRKAGGVIRLTADADVTTHLGIAEGIETALAVTAAMATSAPWLPVWSAIDAGNLADLPVVAGVERLTVFSDTDASGTGQIAARMLAARWHATGTIRWPHDGHAELGRDRGPHDSLSACRGRWEWCLGQAQRARAR